MYLLLRTMTTANPRATIYSCPSASGRKVVGAGSVSGPHRHQHLHTLQFLIQNCLAFAHNPGAPPVYTQSSLESLQHRTHCECYAVVVQMQSRKVAKSRLTLRYVNSCKYNVKCYINSCQCGKFKLCVFVTLWKIFSLTIFNLWLVGSCRTWG